MGTLDDAKKYLLCGFSVIPCLPRSKRPAIAWQPYQLRKPNEAELAEWFSDGDHNIAIITGAVSGVVVLDVDGADGQASVADKELPPTPCVRTAKGAHYYYRHPGGQVRNFARKMPGVDLRGDGGYVLAPPSVHPSGAVYEWALDLEDVPLADVPRWVLDLLRPQQTTGKRTDWFTQALQGVPQGERNNTAARLAGYCHRQGLSNDAALELLRLWNTRNKPPLPDKELVQVVNSIWRYEVAEAPHTVKIMPRFHARPFSLRLLAKHRFWSTGKNSKDDFYRYDADAGLWRDDADSFIDHCLREDDLLPDELKKMHVSEEIIADIRGLSWRPDGLPEPPPFLLPFYNGVYDVRTSTLRAFTAEDYFTWRLPHKFNPSARSEFIADMLKNLDDKIQKHFFEFLAYCLWRGYPFQRFFLWTGRGSNGKGFLANVLTYALGVDNVSSISLSDIENERFAAAHLYHKLANVSGEVRYGDLVNTDLLKKLTGSDFLDADRKYKEPLRFKNYAKLLFLTNEVPRTRDTTDAFYRRTFIVRFEQFFEENPRLLNQIELLAREESAEFEWLLAKGVEILRELMAKNFVLTGALTISDARSLYEKLSNPLRQFIEEQCERTYNAEDFIYKFEFAERFNAWLSERGYNHYSDTRLGTEMKAYNIGDGQRGDQKWRAWVGLRWKE